jgi:ribonuclease VapC
VIDGSRSPIASRRLDDLLREAEIVIEPVTEQHAQTAREAYRDFGRRSGHPAGPTFREPLLFKGDDLVHTGIAGRTLEDS